jgi:heme-degrading monooxygenase HmoA
MIARIWRGTVPASKSDVYLAYLEATGIKDYRATPGNRGVQVLRRATGDWVEFVLITLWDSLDAIRAFAGPDYERAVYYDEDRAYLRELTEFVEHFDVVATTA